MEANGQLYAQATLIPGKELPIPYRQEAGWATDPVWTLEKRKMFAPAGN
jgi:hypothetical protein